MLSSQIRAANPASSTIRQPRRRILYCTLSAVFRSHSRLIPGLSDTIRHSTCLPILFEAVHWHSDSEPRAPFLVHVIPWWTSEILFKDFYHVLFDIFHGFAELHSFCQFFKNRHFSFLPSRRVEATSVGILEEYIGVEPTLSAWRAEVLTVIRILHKIAGEPSFSPAMMFV